MNKFDIVKALLGGRLQRAPLHDTAHAFAPTNIALCKYWGKRNQELNLPVNSSLSISLGNKGATTHLKINKHARDSILVNNQAIDLFSQFGKRLIAFLDLFRQNSEPHLDVVIETNIPIAAGMASSACGFASLTQAMNHLFGWEMRAHQLSILSRLGSGSACRSIWQGFVEWHMGMREDGMDSHGELLGDQWPELCVGILILADKEKGLSSREAMQRTVTTSALYEAWPQKVETDLRTLKQAISVQNFELLGKTAESNAMGMHATMLSAWPPICYFLPETLAAMQKIWQLRREGLAIYFTQDAGPNLKLLFLNESAGEVKKAFPAVEVLRPFCP